MRVGEGATIGANAVVVDDVSRRGPPWSGAGAAGRLVYLARGHVGDSGAATVQADAAALAERADLPEVHRERRGAVRRDRTPRPSQPRTSHGSRAAAALTCATWPGCVSSRRPADAAASRAGPALPDRRSAAEFTRADVTPGLLRAAILRDGCVLVRGLIDRASGATFAEQIDRVVRRARAPGRRTRVATATTRSSPPTRPQRTGRAAAGSRRAAACWPPTPRC